MIRTIKPISIFLSKVRISIGMVIKEIGISLDHSGSNILGDIAYKQKYCSHYNIDRFNSILPTISPKANISDTASVIGEVYISQGASVGLDTIIRGEYNPVRIGMYSNIGDGTVIHTCRSLPQGAPSSVNIGKNVTIGPKCVLYPCIIDDDVKLNAKCVVQDGCRLERGCVLERGSIVPPGKLIPSYTVWGGNPVVFIKNLSEEEKKLNYEESYVHGDINKKLKAEFDGYISGKLYSEEDMEIKSNSA